MTIDQSTNQGGAPPQPSKNILGTPISDPDGTTVVHGIPVNTHGHGSSIDATTQGQGKPPIKFSKRFFDESNLEHSMSSMISLMGGNRESESDPRFLNNVISTVVPNLRKEMEKAKALVEKIAQYPDYNISLATEAWDLADKAQKYISSHIDTYNRLDLGKVGFKSQTTDVLRKFDPQKINVHDFLRLFKARYLHIGTDEDLALKLFDDFLPRDIQVKVGRSRSFNDLEAQLKAILGTPMALARIEMAKIQKLTTPKTQDISQEHAAFYMELFSIIESMNSLGLSKAIGPQEFYSTIASNANLDLIKGTLLIPDQASFIKSIVDNGDDINSIRTEEYFRLLRNYIMSKHRSLAYIDFTLPEPKPKAKQVHSVISTSTGPAVPVPPRLKNLSRNLQKIQQPNQQQTTALHKLRKR